VEVEEGGRGEQGQGGIRGQVCLRLSGVGQAHRGCPGGHPSGLAQQGGAALGQVWVACGRLEENPCMTGEVSALYVRLLCTIYIYALYVCV